MDSYDEDLNENPFFQSLLASCPDLFSQCVLEQWLICVPRRDSLPKYAFTLEDFTHHILKPTRKEPNRHWSGGSDSSSLSSSFLPNESSSGSSDKNGSFDSKSSSLSNFGSASTLKGNWNYRTLTHINVEYSGQTLILDVEVPVQDAENNNPHDGVFIPVPDPGSIQLRKEVLFDETFYTNDRQRYKVLCVASPLNSKADIEDDSFGNSGLGIWNLTSLRDCIDFIWVKGNMKILETYDAYIKLFLHNHSGLENFPLTIQKDLVKTLYMKCLEFAENTGMTEVPDNPALSDFIHQRLKLATETYVLNGVYRSLISAITSVVSSEDASLNKIMRNLAELHPQDLEIESTHWNSLNRARHELGRINSYASPLGKLTSLKRTLRYLRPEASAGNSNTNTLSTDELIPIWVYLIVKNPVGNWVAQLEFLRNFRFSAADQKDNENSFHIVTLEASLEHLKSGEILGITDNERDIGIPSDLGEAWFHSFHQAAFEVMDSQLGEMFDFIRLGNCGRLEELVEEYELQRHEINKEQSEPKVFDGSLLCHPLCNCEKCSTLCRPVKKDAGIVPAVNLTTDEGLTLLHVACIYGRPKVVDFLIGAGAPVGTQDSQGMSPLHYAASRGHQNALLLLLHAGASLEQTNNALDTPLHLAAQNGHEGCVKALIYYAEHARNKINVSARNSKGDTPLHFASRWGFQGIVHILTEHGAAITISNVRHATPIDCAHDIHILKILQRSMRRRSLVQLNYGDFVNIEMLQKEDTGGIVMLISEPEEQPSHEQSKDINEVSGERSSPSPNNSRGSSRVPTRANSRSGSRRNSSVVVPTLVMPGSTPRSRRNSSTRNPIDEVNQINLLIPGSNRSRRTSSTRNPLDEVNQTIIEETEKCLLDVAEHLRQDPACPNFVLNYYDDPDPDEQDHVRRISVESLESSRAASVASGFAGFVQPEDRLDNDMRKLFTAITVDDLPLALFYLGIPAEELENPENNRAHILPISPCHPLCPCSRCIAKNAGLGLGLDVKNSDGYAPIHLAVQFSLIVLVKILIRYGADVNTQSTFERKTALDMAAEKGLYDIEDILEASGGLPSTNFFLESPECEK